MPAPNPAAADFLRTRRSRPAKTLGQPVPEKAALMSMIEAAARVPDHGKLEPWRFIVLSGDVFARLSALVAERGAALGKTPEEIAKACSQFDMANLAVVVVFSPKPSPKVPESEQFLSAGSVCLGLVNAALADGWGANWLSGWPSHDLPFLRDGLGLAEGELVAGLIHIGTEKSAPPERPRPDVAALTEWLTE